MSKNRGPTLSTPLGVGHHHDNHPKNIQPLTSTQINIENQSLQKSEPTTISPRLAKSAVGSSSIQSQSKTHIPREDMESLADGLRLQQSSTFSSGCKITLLPKPPTQSNTNVVPTSTLSYPPSDTLSSLIFPKISSLRPASTTYTSATNGSTTNVFTTDTAATNTSAASTSAANTSTANASTSNASIVNVPIANTLIANPSTANAFTANILSSSLRLPSSSNSKFTGTLDSRPSTFFPMSSQDEFELILPRNVEAGKEKLASEKANLDWRSPSTTKLPTGPIAQLQLLEHSKGKT
ncbi:hypothetical protein HOY82DRAFT_541130 [Tuber indicum]|nr:hypothetical protein HOY82DRAFT_541130 [Tuber indicum]